MTPPVTIRRVTRPGLAKARVQPIVLSRTSLLVRTAEPWWRDRFDRADVLSEGGVRDEAHGRVWYGSTSLILPSAAGEDGALLAAIARRTGHVRLRALRVACREASLRAPGRLGRLVCEIHISADVSGVRIDVDVQAPLIERRAVSRRTP
jgi:hypothetical protein